MSNHPGRIEGRRRLRSAINSLLAAGIVAGSALSFQATAKAEETDAVSTLDVFGAQVEVPIPFKRVKTGSDFSEQNAMQYLAEFVPAGQSVYDWTEMVSVRGYDARIFDGAAAFQVMDLIAQQISQSCPDSFVEESLPGPVIGKFETAAALLGCRPVQTSQIPGLGAGQAEIGVFVVVRSERTFFELHHSRRAIGDMAGFDDSGDPAVQQALHEFLGRIRICIKSPDGGACKQ